MADVTCIGLGLMGSALARAFLKNGHAVEVWNRSPGKADDIALAGATVAGGLAEAIASSPVVVFCLADYQTTKSLIATAGAESALKGKTIVQLSTGTSKEARAASAWFAGHGADYLDGAILGGPAAIGTPRVTLLYSGPESVFQRIVTLLAALGENTRLVGGDPGAAAAVDFAWLINRYGIYLSAAHGCLICEAEGVGLEHYAEVFTPNDPARWVIDVIRTNSFAKPGATLSVWKAALARIAEQIEERGLDDSLSSLVQAVLERAEQAGYGEEHIAAMVKVLRRSRS